MRRAARAALWLLFLPAAAPCGAAAAGQPLFLWRIESPTATVTLVGSVHVGRADFFPLATPFEEAFAAADDLAVEVDPDSPANAREIALLMLQKGRLPGDETLADHLSPELMARLEAFAAERGASLDLVRKFRPGIAAVLLVMQEYRRQGLDPELGIDRHFLDQARAAAKPILELETVAAQLDLFLAVDDRLDDLLLGGFLDQMPDLAALTGRMLALWQAGDVAGLDALLQEQIGDDPQLVDFYRRLLDDRNAAMAAKIDAWLAGDRDVFVVVGAGHFGGDQGVLKLLADRGWRLTQLED